MWSAQALDEEWLASATGVVGEEWPEWPGEPLGPADIAAGIPAGIPAGIAAGFAADELLDHLAPGPALAGFAQDAWADGLGMLSDDALVGLLQAWRRLASWAAAGEFAAVAELDRRRTAEVAGGADPRLAEHVGDELAASLTLTTRSADALLDIACGLERLPLTRAALAAGRIDRTRALVITEGVSCLSDTHAAAVESAVIGRAPGQTSGQLRAATQRAVLAVDPAAAERRREKARKDARVEVWDERCGTAALAGRDLPPADVLAADKRIDALARRLKSSGHEETLSELRAVVYLALLRGQPIGGPAAEDASGSGTVNAGSRSDQDGSVQDGSVPTGPGAEGSGASPARPEPAGHPGPRHPAPGNPAPEDLAPGNPAPGDLAPGPAPSGPAAPGSAASGPVPAEPVPAGPVPAGPVPAGPVPAGPADPGPTDSGVTDSGSAVPGSSPAVLAARGTADPGSAASGPLPTGSAAPGLAARGSSPGGSAAPGLADTGAVPAGAGLTGSINLTMPLDTWLGGSAEPGEAAGFGPLPADDARALAGLIAGQPGARWCLTLTGRDGHAVAHGCAVAGAPAAGRDGRPRGEPRSGRDGPAGREVVAPRAGPPDDWALTVTVRPLAAGECLHRRESPGYRPAPSLRHLINVRQRTCGFPGCRNPAARCDQDHTIPHDKGGRTCECNLACLCRRHHQAKQAQGWRLVQPEPGVLLWRLPHGRSYRVEPPSYPG